MKQAVKLVGLLRNDRFGSCLKKFKDEEPLQRRKMLTMKGVFMDSKEADSDVGLTFRLQRTVAKFAGEFLIDLKANVELNSKIIRGFLWFANAQLEQKMPTKVAAILIFTN